jgi:dienelactone hydrolase
MNKANYLMLIIAIFLVSCTQQFEKTDGKITGPLPRNQIQDIELIKEISNVDIELITEDNVGIKATFYKGDKDKPSIILIHMLNGNRNDWDDFAKILQEIGYNVVAIDSRGHGESDLKWKSFSEDDFNKMVLDVKAAKVFLEDENLGNIALIGASIGANTALNFAAQDNSIKTVILLSPGLDYRGVTTSETIKQFTKPTLIVASEGDTFSADSSRTLDSLSQDSVLKIYEGSEHGTRLFGKTDIDMVIIDWLQAYLN